MDSEQIRKFIQDELLKNRELPVKYAINNNTKGAGKLELRAGTYTTEELLELYNFSKNPEHLGQDLVKRFETELANVTTRDLETWISKGLRADTKIKGEPVIFYFIKNDLIHHAILLSGTVENQIIDISFDETCSAFMQSPARTKPIYQVLFNKLLHKAKYKGLYEEYPKLEEVLTKYLAGCPLDTYFYEICDKLPFEHIKVFMIFNTGIINFYTLVEKAAKAGRSDILTYLFAKNPQIRSREVLMQLVTASLIAADADKPKFDECIAAWINCK